MTYATLCSGIGAPEKAFADLGWRQAFCAEIEAFPCAVLEQRFPGVPNLGDVTKITKAQVESFGRVDLLCFGFPCQDLSVAGQRKGLTHADGSHTRSGLFYACAKIAEWLKCRWVVAENVPGLFSSNAGRDFAAVVGELAGSSFDVPREGWRNTGVALGPKGLVEWVVLDAQYRGVPQRRNRVFIVRDSGDWANRPPLFLEPSCMFGNPPARSEKREGIAPTISARTKGGGGLGTDAECDGAVIPFEQNTQCSTPELPSIRSNPQNYGIAHSLRARGFDASEDGTGRGTPIVPEIVPQAMSSKWAKGSSGPAGDEVANLVAFSSKDHGADAGAISPTLRASNHDKSHASGGAPPAIAFQPRIGRNGRGDMGDKVNALNAQSGQTGKGDAAPCVAFQSSQSGVREVEAHATLDSNNGSRRHNGVVQGYAVRRLTPQECASLQGFPRDWCDIVYRGKPACDGPKYKAYGNSMAVPVVRYIGERIALLDRLLD